MNTFLGCDPLDLRNLTDTVAEHARRFLDLLEELASLAASVPWTGPDADAFREGATAVLSEGRTTAAALSRRGQVLTVQADQQDGASAADSSAVGPTDSGRWAEGLRSELPSPGEDRWNPTSPRNLGGPFAWDGDPAVLTEAGKSAARKMVDLVRDLEHDDRLDVEEGGLRYEPAHLDSATMLRTAALKNVPYAGPIQALVGAQSTLEGAADSGEKWLITNGHEEYLPLMRGIDASLAITGIALGEESVAGQTLGVIDQNIANLTQTSQNVFTEAREGDGMGVMREVEYGMLRQTANQTTLLTASPLGALLGAGDEVFGAADDLAEPLSPAPLEQTLEAGESFFSQTRDDYESHRDLVTDPQIWLRERRERAPMPWDPETAA